jgi:YD repeat-containing protein
VMRVILKDLNGNTISSKDSTYGLTNNDYQYFTCPVKVSSAPTIFTVQVQGISVQGVALTPNTNTGLPMLDDIGFYPNYASITSTTYDIPFGSNSVTDPSGTSLFTSYDGLGRVKLVTDQDHNIRKRISYAAKGQILPTTIIAAVDSIRGVYEINKPIQFIARAHTCITGVTYEWDLGTGFSAPGSSNVSAAQTYITTGNKSLTLRVSHPLYGTQTTTFSFYINPPLSVTICPTGVKEMRIMVVTQTYNCFTNPNPSNWITCKVTQTAGDLSTWTYQWKEHRIGMPDWINVMNNSTNTYGRQVLWREGSFEVSCTVTTSDGRTATSAPVLVTVSQTQ